MEIEMKKISYLFLILFLIFTQIGNCQAYWIYLQAKDYENGTNGMEQSYKKAFLLYVTAAEKECPMAEYELGMCYHNGKGVQQSDENALFWLTKSAEHGYAAAQAELGWFYSQGIACDASYFTAIYWWTKAANQGDTIAIFNLQQRGRYQKMRYVDVGE